ncbi:amino acid ABC transporter ATP-binding protein [Murdochiella massiliensis]|uniref:amino acid ABC transporter ATP-binding protein n=1 Tax=Murdochiella massiliensis TaxID=1673723 RepID=UPI0008376D2C|nr:amino acid ABC transporter ATP-binding protein [Murdochiella massiliensis]
MEKQAILTINHLEKTFGAETVLKDISLTLHPGEVVSLIGPSGAGKSTFLRCINLLEEPTAGEILFHDQSILAPKFDLLRYHAKVGMVFQQFNLFRNLSVLENCTLAQVKVLGREKQEARDVAMNNLRRVGMADYDRAKPAQLSGGQQQRVAIARALSMDPEVLLFDEPTSALDPQNVGEVLSIIEDLAKGGMTMMVVSHDISFARRIAHRVAFLRGGYIEEIGTPEEIFLHPKSEALQQFVQQQE